MALDSYKKKKTTRRSFVLPPEIVESLSQIQLAQEFNNPSETLRFCVAFTYEQLSQPTPAAPNDRLLTLVTKSHTMLQFLLIEIIKAHGGKDEPNKEEQQLYLKKLNQRIKSCLKQRGIRE
jgi:hypothetical protein